MKKLMLFFPLFLLHSSFLFAEIIENSSLSTSYPWIKEKKKYVFELEALQNTSGRTLNENAYYSMKALLPVSPLTLGSFKFQTNGNLILGLGYQFLQEYEFSLYTPNTFIYFEQTLPYAPQEVTRALSPRYAKSHLTTTLGVYILKELDQTDLYSELQFNYHHAQNIKNTSLNETLRTSPQFSSLLDMGFQYYIPYSRFSLGISSGVELRSPLKVTVKEREQSASEMNYSPYINMASRFSYALSKHFFLQLFYKDETILSNQGNSDDERTLGLKAQYQLF